MSNFAIIENGIVVDVIICENKEIAQSITNKECVEYPDDDLIGIGYIWNNAYNRYLGDSPHPLWEWNQNEKRWQAPFEKPNEDKLYRWSDSLQNWEEIIISAE
jgi:hypothetical protein